MYILDERWLELLVHLLSIGAHLLIIAVLQLAAPTFMPTSDATMLGHWGRMNSVLHGSVQPKLCRFAHLALYLSYMEMKCKIVKRVRCYLDSVHMAKAPTLHASPGLPHMSDASPSQKGFA